MATKIITISFYLLFALTPFLWAPWNFELFEYNKMMFVYFLTTLITACWILGMIKAKKIVLKTTPLDFPLMLFLLANILSTIFSIDRHISLWGYYSRSNGGLLSLISYLLLYYAFVSHFNKDQVIKCLKAAIFGGVAVSLYAIPEHFGISPSCIILTGNFNASCWVQDVQARVFATLGQPNWLAAYLAMVIFPTIYFLLTSTKKSFFILNSLFLILLYSAFTFTYSRGATLGFLAGLGIFSLLFFIPLFRYVIARLPEATEAILSESGIASSVVSLLPRNDKKESLINPRKSVLIILSIIICVNLLFGSALTDFKLLAKFAGPSRPSLTASRSLGTQLENGGTESGSIRLIVWKGAIDIFKHYPIFGSGVETFAFSYYQFRPVEHNLVSEWDFLYNKAHNEFLNYLATTGILGFLSYCIIIITFIIFILKKAGAKNILLYSLLASYISYLVQNFFGFSVVIIALFFYLFPALAFVFANSTKPFSFPKKLLPVVSILWLLLYKRPFCASLAKLVVVVVFGLIGLTILRYYIADTFFAEGNKLSDSHPSQAYNQILLASSLNPGEPYYRSELGYAAAASAATIADSDATESARLKIFAQNETNTALSQSPRNVSFLRTAVRAYYYLSTIDKNYTFKTLKAMDQAINLAPTDAKLVYNKALILGQMGKNPEAIKNLEETITLKPNYKEAYYSLGQFYFEEEQTNKAIKAMEGILKFIPNDPDALAKINEWKGK